MSESVRSKAFEKKTFSLPLRLTGNFDDVSNRLGVSSDAELVRHALKLLFFVEANIEEGERIVIHKKDGREIELGLFI
ncbi:MAG: hypothetical protein AAF830_02160 [Pseudomonadota bacterium]